MSRDLNRLLARVQPSERVVSVSQQSQIDFDAGDHRDLRASRHAGASLGIANRSSILLFVMDDADEIPQVAVMLNDCWTLC